MLRGWTSRIGASLTIVVLVLAIGALAAGPSGAQEAPTTAPVQIEDVDSPLGDIIPKPNSGVAPADGGDRGGSLQLTLLALIGAFFAIAIFSVRRSILKARSTTLG